MQSTRFIFTYVYVKWRWALWDIYHVFAPHLCDVVYSFSFDILRIIQWKISLSLFHLLQTEHMRYDRVWVRTTSFWFSRFNIYYNRILHKYKFILRFSPFKIQQISMLNSTMDIYWWFLRKESVVRKRRYGELT